MSSQNSHANTPAVHAGEKGSTGTPAIVTPTFGSTTYRFRTMDEAIEHLNAKETRQDYSRYGNPTIIAAERKLAQLEEAEESLLFASGMAAITTTLLALLSQGQHVILVGEVYRPTEVFLQESMARYGITTTCCDFDDLEGIQATIQPGTTRVIFLESLSNPHQNVADLAAIRQLAAQAPGLKLVVDATLASPLNDTALAAGAHLVIQSASKYLGGHNDLLGGAVSGTAEELAPVRQLRGQLGGVMDARGASLLLRGMRTLPLRIAQHNRSAQAIAEWLQAHPRVREVFYAGLPSHPSHALAHARMRGFGGLLAAELDTDEAGTARFCEALQIFQLAPSFGGAESLIHPPAVFSFRNMALEGRLSRGIQDSLIRLAVGLEDTDDLIADLEQAFAVI